MYCHKSELEYDTRQEYLQQYYKLRVKKDPNYWSKVNAARVERRKLYMNNYNANPTIKKKNSAWSIKKGRIVRRAIIELLGSECVRCGNNDFRVLQVDHINGDGAIDRLKSSSYEKYLKEPLEAIKKLQVLCANCNWIKRHEEREYMHIIKREVT